MKTPQLLNYERDRWIAGDGAVEIPSAIDGSPVATTGSSGVDFGGMLRHAREVGGPALRKLTFHERARMIKALGLAIMARKEELYELNYADRRDAQGRLDRHRGRRGHALLVLLEGPPRASRRACPARRPARRLSKQGTFVGQHIYTSLQGAAVHINAFNFPVWGMLEKLAPTLLAGVPAIVKPASATAYLAEAAFRVMIEANILPPGAVQLIVGGVGDLFDHLTGQDVVSFTGSAHDRAQAPHASDCDARIGPLRRRAGQPQRLAARPRRSARNARVRPVHQGSRDRDDGQGGAEMHRDPPRHGSGRASRRGPGGARGAAGEDQGRRPARRGHAHGRPGQRQPARRRPREDRRAGGGRRADRRGRSLGRAADRGRRVPGAGPASHRRPVAHRRGTRLRAVRAGVDDHALQATSPTRSRWPTAAGAACACRCSPIRPRRRATSSRARPRSMGGCWSSTATMPRNRPATARRCRCWSTAAPAAPAAARRWAASAASSITCSAPRSSRSPAMIAAITEQYIAGAPKRFVDVHPFRSG